jgi:hypothetical protein
LVAVLLFSTLALGTGLSESPAAPAADAKFALDHFACYPARFSSFTKRKVRLEDQFGRLTAVVIAPERMCAPVDKNGEGIRNKRAHLTCYTIKAGSFTPRRVKVKNQFGSQAMVVARPLRLCAPSAKSLQGSPGNPPTTLDHYTCYAVDPGGTVKLPTVVLTDQFGRAKAAVLRASTLCAPTMKDKTRVLQPRLHLTCYEIKSGAVKTRTVVLRSQFGLLKAGLGRRMELCVPSTKSARADLTVQIVARTQVSCPGGQGTCVSTVAYVVSNVGAVGAASFDVLVEADPSLSVAKTVSVSGLAAGASQSLSTSLPAGNNCYDPDCTVRVAVDSGDVVLESDETNNVATRTDLG